MKVAGFIGLAIAKHTFAESKAGSIVYAVASKIALLRGWLEQASDAVWPATARYVDAMARSPASGEPTPTAFNIAFDARGSCSDEIAKSPNSIQK